MEFALVLPLIILLILGIIEAGRLLFIYSAATTASREAARYGAAAGDIGGYVAHYEDCSGIRTAAKKMGSLAGIQDGNITITYDHGPGTSSFSSCPPAEDIELGDRVVVQVQASFQPIILYANFQPFTFTSSSRRTILKDVRIEGTPPAPPVPIVSFSLDSQSGYEDIVGSMSLLVRLSAASNQDVVVPFVISGSASGLGVDYTITSSPLVFPAGDTMDRIVIIEVIPDAIDEENETIVITMGTPINATKGSPNVHVATILDDDQPPEVSFNLASQSFSEDGGMMTIGAHLSSVSGKTVTVPFSVSGTAESGTEADYTISDSPLIFAVGSINASISVQVLDDDVDEDDETVVVTFGDPTNATKGTPSEHTATIVDNDTAIVSFVWANQDVAEEAGSSVVAVQVSTPSEMTINVPFDLSGTATLGEDFTLLTSSPLEIPAGNLSIEINFTITADMSVEGNETVIVTMGTPLNAEKGTPSEHTMTLIDTPVPPPVVAFNSASQSKSEDGTSMSIFVQLSAATHLPVTVPFSVSGTATLGAEVDYTITSSPVVIPAGYSTAKIKIYLNDDAINEASEIVTVTMETPVNATKGSPSVHTATIVDNDTAPTVSFNSSSQSAGEETGSMTVTMTLSSISGQDVTVPYTVSGTALEGAEADYTITTSPVIIPTGNLSNNITIQMNNDSIEESDETVIITMGEPTNAIKSSPFEHTATIVDDDTPCVIGSGALSFGTRGSGQSDQGFVAWTLTNLDVNDIIRLTTLIVQWPNVSPERKLSGIELDSTVIWSSANGISGAVCSSQPPTVCYTISEGGWTNPDVTARNFTPGQSRILTVLFNRTLATGFYSLNSTFINTIIGGTCSASNQADYTAP